MCVPRLNFVGLIVPEKSVKKILMFENWKEKWHKGMNKQQQSDFGMHNTPSCCPSVYEVLTL